MNNRYREEEKNKENIDEIKVETPEEVIIEEKPNEELAKIQEENKKLKEQYLRVLADSENFRKRIDEERIRERKYGSQRLLEKLVNSIDIFDKVVNIKTDDEKLKNFLIGFEMINNDLKQIIQDEGVKKIKTIGEKFDPRFHHAVETEWVETKDEDIILEETQSGYMYKDRVLRVALVKVNKKNEEKKENNKMNK